MEFLNIIKELVKEYEGNIVRRQNNTLLLGPCDIPKCRHMLFAPLTKEYYDVHLISQYKNKFPDEYLYLLEYINGFDLFNVRIKSNAFQFAYSILTIFGLPVTPPYSRQPDMEEPADLRVEDNLRRHRKTPSSWLKCGQFIKNYNFNDVYALYIDTKTGKVFSTIADAKKFKIEDEWENLDSCLCSIYNEYKDCKEEYEFK